jgi:hypothetical protein
MIYPYLRLWKLSRKVLADVAKVLLLGRRAVLKCLLRMRKVMEKTDSLYLLNRLFIDESCLWVQRLEEANLEQFAKAFNEAKNWVEKGGPDLLGLKLPQLQKWAEKRQRQRELANSEYNTDDCEDEDEDEEECDDEKECEEGTIPSRLIHLHSLPKEEPEKYGYLSTEVSECGEPTYAKDRDENHVGDAKERLAELFRMEVKDTRSTNHFDEKVSARRVLIEELPTPPRHRESTEAASSPSPRPTSESGEVGDLADGFTALRV